MREEEDSILKLVTTIRETAFLEHHLRIVYWLRVALIWALFHRRFFENMIASLILLIMTVFLSVLTVLFHVENRECNIVCRVSSAFLQEYLRWFSSIFYTWRLQEKRSIFLILAIDNLLGQGFYMRGVAQCLLMVSL